MRSRPIEGMETFIDCVREDKLKLQNSISSWLDRGLIWVRMMTNRKPDGKVLTKMRKRKRMVMRMKMMREWKTGMINRNLDGKVARMRMQGLIRLGWAWILLLFLIVFA